MPPGAGLEMNAAFRMSRDDVHLSAYDLTEAMLADYYRSHKGATRRMVVPHNMLETV
jgi:hypothetical protein